MLTAGVGSLNWVWHGAVMSKTNALVKKMSLLTLLLAPLTAQAIVFQTRVENVEWLVEGDRFECRLIHPISDFGRGVFVRRAGEKTFLRVQSTEAWFMRGQVRLYAAAAPWQSAQTDLSLGVAMVARNERVVETSQAQGERLLTALLEGRSPVLRHSTVQSVPLEVRIQPSSFPVAYDDFLQCTNNLLPVNFEQIRQTLVRFEAGSYDLGENTRKHLDLLLEYLAEDQSVNRITLDGHLDNSGDRLLNRDVSRRRALAVKAYLGARGFDEDAIVVRFHGERYPLKKNNTAAGRAANRRVAIRLERIDTEVVEMMEKVGDDNF